MATRQPDAIGSIGLRAVDVFPLDLLTTVVREPIFVPPFHLQRYGWRAARRGCGTENELIFNDVLT